MDHITFINHKDCLSFKAPNLIWDEILWLAQEYGWEPVGTLKPPDWPYHGCSFCDVCYYGCRFDKVSARWCGGYGPSGQTVTTEDAHAITGALERALADAPQDDLPRRPAVVGSQVFVGNYELHWLVTSAGRDVANGNSQTPLRARDLIRPGTWGSVRDFAEFCRKGGFVIC